MKNKLLFWIPIALALGPTLVLLAQQGGGTPPSGGGLVVSWELPNRQDLSQPFSGEYSEIRVQNAGPDPVEACAQRDDGTKECRELQQGQPFVATGHTNQQGVYHPITRVTISIVSGDDSASGTAGFLPAH